MEKDRKEILRKKQQKVSLKDRVHSTIPIPVASVKIATATQESGGSKAKKAKLVGPIKEARDLPALDTAE
jgi:hypothetical protein